MGGRASAAWRSIRRNWRRCGWHADIYGFLVFKFEVETVNDALDLRAGLRVAESDEVDVKDYQWGPVAGY